VRNKFSIISIFLLLCVFTTVTFGQVTVTPGSGGTDLARSTSCANGTPGGYATLGDITITETKNGDIAVSQTNVTLILTPPSNWQFNPGVGTGQDSGGDVTFNSINVVAGSITVTITSGSQPNSKSIITLSGIQVQSIDGNTTPATGNILRTSGNPGTAVITGITNDVTNFGSLSTVHLSL
jgi:hypothetical protein